MPAECKYCDNPMPPVTIGDDLVCSRCGAEWADAKIMVEDEECDLEELEDWDTDEGECLKCGCVNCCSCED